MIIPSCGQAFGEFRGSGIAVESDDAGPGVQQGAGIAASPEGAVDDGCAPHGLESFENLAHEDGDMRGAHPAPPG